MSQKKGLALTHKYVNPDEFCYFNNHIVWYSPVFEVFKMGCDISVGQGTEFLRPDIVESQSQPLFLTHPLLMPLLQFPTKDLLLPQQMLVIIVGCKKYF